MILAIETSCDETSVAVLNGKNILSNVLYSQVKHHHQYGGVVPELASRLHAEFIDQILDDALKKAAIQLSDIRHIAVTVGPGLEGALLVGITAANMLAQSLKIPIIPVNHLHGHIYAAMDSGEIVTPSLICLASGGHTMIVEMTNPLEFNIVANTMDDACGECFDKVARMLDLGYPGGPKIEALAKSGKASVNLPHPVKKNPKAFSFSGLKTAAKLAIEKKVSTPENIAASLQACIGSILVEKLKLAIEQTSYKQLILCGGVFANQSIRQAILNEVAIDNILIPNIKLCTDNAAMIGLAANEYLNHGYSFSNYSQCYPSFGLKLPEKP